MVEYQLSRSIKTSVPFPYARNKTAFSSSVPSRVSGLLLVAFNNCTEFQQTIFASLKTRGVQCW